MSQMENMRVALSVKELLDEVSTLHAQKKHKAAIEMVGECGEKLTERYFLEKGIGFEKIPQKLIKKLPKSMEQYSAKRADYHLDIGDEFVNEKMVVADSKHYRAHNEHYFALSKGEIAKYTGLVEYLKHEYDIQTVHVLFVVWVQGYTNKVNFYLLDEFEDQKKTSKTTVKDIDTGKSVDALQIKLIDAYQENINWQ